MDKDVHNENLTLQKEASNLLASEMSEIKGGTMSSICIRKRYFISEIHWSKRHTNIFRYINKEKFTKNSTQKRRLL